MEPYMTLTVHYVTRDFTMKITVGDGRGNLLRPKRSLSYQNTSLKLSVQQDGAPDKLWSRGVLEQLPAISHVLSSDRKARHLVPTWQDVEVLEALNKTLSPLTDFTDALSGEQYVSISSVKPVLHLFETSVVAVQEDDLDLTRSIKSKVLVYLQEKYSDPNTQELLDIATSLDPRFKMDYIHEDKKTTIKARLTHEMTGITSVVQSSTSTASPASPMKKSRKTLGSFLKAAKGNEASSQPEQDVVSELQSYLLLSNIDSEADPLVWWREHKGEFPRLSILAKKYLCIPATSSPSERVFSTGGDIVTCLRSSLKPQNVDRLVFLAKNL
ncbi:E3 SUMO-protein ligase ZBED1-like [Oreochromis aureus]|uniref:E3 SUMO-protein ligase ZBED1-like n=1 Tax=Oreochromis aureus TaxID=47969 RepID=UPI0019540A2C|nr:E3 SUMO-protein ligase ZBED1-like [Oreochromis aureus]